jgi:hypothetical protein
MMGSPLILQQVKTVFEYLPNGRVLLGLEAQEAVVIKEFFIQMITKCQKLMMRSYPGKINENQKMAINYPAMHLKYEHLHSEPNTCIWAH